MVRGMNWGLLLERHAQKRKNKLALVFEDKKFTYGELNDLVNQMANYLWKLGIKKGDRVGIYLPNCWEHIVAHFGILKIGAIVIPFNPMYKSYEIQYMLEDSGAETVITIPELYPYVKEVEKSTKLKNIIGSGSTEPGRLSFGDILKEPRTWEHEIPIDEREDLALLQYTSGTTGKPKGAMLTYHNVFSNVRTNTNLYDYDESDVQLIVLPLFHSFGIFSVYYSIYVGGLIVLVRRYDGELVFSLIDQFRVTSFFCVPPMLLGVLNVKNPERFTLNSLRVCLCGGAMMPVEIMKRVKELLGVEVVDGYGLTESYGFIMTPYLDRFRYKPGSIGIPIPVQEVRIVNDRDEDVPIGEVGEIVARGPIVMKGYWNKPEETKEAMRNGWFHTGDLAQMDEEGYYYIVGRKKELIISSGFNIYPKEIEELLYQHPKIADAAVIGVPHEYKGEAVKAYIILQEGAQATPEEIIDYCRSKLAVFKAPTIVEFRKALPRTASGKVLKRVLQEEVLPKAKAPGPQ